MRFQRSVLLCSIGCALAAAISSTSQWFSAYAGGAMFGDVALYYLPYADRVVSGEVPYRDFPVEYPPLAIPLFVLPRLLAGPGRGYAPAFGALMWGLAALTAWAVGSSVRRSEGTGRVGRRLLYFAGCYATLCPLAIARYDIGPALLAFVGAEAIARGRGALGGVVAASGALMKVFPGLVVGPALVKGWATAGPRGLRGPLAFGLILAAGAGLWLGLGGRGALASIRYQTDREAEVCSVYGGIYLASAALAGRPAPITSGHGTVEVLSPWSFSPTSWALPIQAAALLGVMALYRRSGMRDEVRWQGATLVAFVATSKVFSPQFMIWMLPFVAACPGRAGRRARPAYLACCLVSRLVFPIFYPWLAQANPWVVAILNARNLLVFALLAIYLFSGDDPGAAESKPAV